MQPGDAVGYFGSLEIQVGDAWMAKPGKRTQKSRDVVQVRKQLTKGPGRHRQGSNTSASRQCQSFELMTESYVIHHFGQVSR